MTTIDTPSAGTAAAQVTRARVLSRRYYPLAIGATFLGLVVGFFPSTVPTSTLGFIPRLSAPAAQLPAAQSPAAPAAPAPTTLPAQPSAVASFPPVVEPSFASPVTSPGGNAQGSGTAPPVTAPSTTPTGTGKVGTAPARCPLPLPAEPPAPPAAELIELFAAAGPFGPEATAGAPALAPVVPVVAPLFPLAGGVAGGKGGVLLSTTLVEIANLEDEVFAPFSKEIAASTPSILAGDEAFFRDLGPVLSLASSLPDLNCVADVEIAAGATLEPADYPGAVPLTAAPGAAAPDQSATPAGVAVASTSWAEGVTPAFAQAVNTDIAEGRSVEVRLADDVPAGPAGAGVPDTEGFANWVGATVKSFPKVAIWEVDPYGGATAPAGAVAPSDPAGAMAGALGAAARARAPGQLLGIGLPDSAASWWPELGTALAPDVRAVVNFAGLDTTALNGGAALPPAGVRWVVSLVRRGVMAQAGLPNQLALFVTAGTDAPEPAATQSAQASQDATALSGLGVGLFAWSSPSTLSGQLTSGDGDAGSLWRALVRPAAS